MAIRYTPKMLRYALAVDAAASGMMGLLLLVGAEFLGALFGIPRDILTAAGYILLPFALFVGALALRTRPFPAGVWTVIVINFAWVTASLLVITSAGLEPTALGYAFVVLQALAVFAFAEAEFLTLRGTNARREPVTI